MCVLVTIEYLIILEHTTAIFEQMLENIVEVHKKLLFFSILYQFYLIA